MEFIKGTLEDCKHAINSRVEGLEGWQIVAYCVGGTVVTIYVWNKIFDPEAPLKERVIKGTFRLLKKIPYVKNQIKEQLSKSSSGMEKTFHDSAGGMAYMKQLPAQGWSEEKIFSEIKKYQSLVKVNWGKGSCSGVIYNGDEALSKLVTKVFGEFVWTNPLHADVFPDIRKMEAEVIAMGCRMFNGSVDACGSMTSGGTESIMCAVKAYRDLAMDRGIKYPEMVVPITAHAAFDKAAAYFRIRIIHTPVNEQTRKADVKAMRKAITRNTIMLAGSVPAYPHGAVDPIEDIAKLGEYYNIPVHVDSCLGGFMVPFMKAAGYPLPLFDFRLPGVTSISADTHKYGYAPKGSSLILYKNKDYRKFQYFVQPDWPGGIYACPTFAGSRPGAIIAACWATMVFMGQEQYIAFTKRIIETRMLIEQRLRQIKDIFVYGKPEVAVLAVGSDKFNIYNLADLMSKKGWHMGKLQFPASIQMCFTLVHTRPGIAEAFIKDMEDSVVEIMKDPKAEKGPSAVMYGQAQSLPDRSIVSEVASCYWDAYYNTQP